MSKRVFVSSTSKDLEQYRSSVRNAIRQLGAIDVAMEHFGARDEMPLIECLKLVREKSDVFVGIYAHRYGFIPDGQVISISEAEYNAATEKPLPRFIYIIDDDTPWPPKNMDKGEASTKLEAFKARLKKDHICSSFTSPDDLARKVAADLGRHFGDKGKDPGILAKTRRYLDHLITVNQHLPVAGFETNLRIPIPLDKVYVQLQARMSEVQRALDPHRASAKHDEHGTGFDEKVTAQQALLLAINKHYDGLVILGQPGSGKTTLAKYFALCFAAETAKETLGIDKQLLPILVFLRHVDPAKTLVQNIQISLQDYSLDLDDSFFLERLHEGKAILLLDGLDEVPTEEKRAEVSKWIHNKVHLAFPKSPVVVTSRFSGYRGDAVLPGAYLRLEIQDYDFPQIKQFIENWLTAVETHLHEDSDYWRSEARRVANDLYNRIESTSALKELAINPLMLQIIALVHRDRGALPDRRVELYKECTDVMLERWDKSKGLRVLLSAAQARQLLQPVALWMHLVENRREVPYGELRNYVESIISSVKKDVKPEELLKSWQERSGIFKGEGDVFFFHHLSFQEYLTAEQIRNEGKHEILVRNFDNAWWREPTLLAVGLTNPTIFSNFMRLLLREAGGNGAETDFMLHCIDEAIVKSEDPFIEALTTSNIFESKYRSLLALERIDTPKAKAGVRGALQDEDSRIADLARSILAKWGEVPIEEKEEFVSVQVKGKALRLPVRRFSPIEHNAEYILIPGGKYKYSVTKKQTEVPPLYVAKYPVTNKQYRRFIQYLRGEKVVRESESLPLNEFAESLVANAKPIEGMLNEIGEKPGKWMEQLISRYDDDKRFNGDDQPVVGVSWYAAVAYCHWLTELAGKTSPEKVLFRLPNETEWEWIASGGKRTYPWGEEERDEKRANYDSKVGQTTPVGAYPAGATPEGLMDVAGNVWEWMQNKYDEDSLYRALRGGSWDDVPENLRCGARSFYSPDLWNSVFIGFRVVLVPSSF